MGIVLHRPCAALIGQIDAFWELTGECGGAVTDTLLPDGCVDLVLSAGDDFYIPSENTTLKHGRVHLGGAFTHSIRASAPPEVRLIGVRFKPGCFSQFYQYESLQVYKNVCREVPLYFMPDLKALSSDLFLTLNTFFTRRMQPASHVLADIIEHMTAVNGDIGISSLTRQYYITERQLERQFAQYVGLSPKQFSGVLRFSYAHRLLATSSSASGLLGLALEAGYYDHAHFCKEFKKYTGQNPSTPNVGFVQATR